MIEFDKLFQPHSKEQRAALREDIGRNGVKVPVLITTDGTVIDGHTRVAIATEFGIEYETEVFEGSESECLSRLVLANGNRRPLRKEAMSAVIMALHGWSNPRIAEVLGVDETTVLRHRSTSANADVEGKPDRRVGKDGKARPTKRATPEQAEARRDSVVAYTEQGYRRDDICKALGIGAGTLYGDLRARGIERGDLPQAHRSDKPTPLDWRNLEKPKQPPQRKSKRKESAAPVPPPPETPRWRLPDTTVVLKRAELFVSEMTDTDGANMVAWAFHAAREAEGTNPDAVTWLREVRRLLARLVDQADRLNRIATDPVYEERARLELEGREAYHARLRIVGQSR